MMEIQGLENNVPVRMIYIDDKTEVTFKSMARASRHTNINQDSIKQSLNPILKRRFTHNNREIVFRIYKNK
jgi:hypothetical protein